MYILPLPLLHGGLVIPFLRKIISSRTHYAFSNLRIVFLKCIQICARFISWLYHIISTSHTRTQPSRVFPGLSLLLAVHNRNRHFDEMKQHRADSLPLSHCHGEKANSVKFGSQQCWNAWLRIHFRNISLNSYSPLRRWCGAQAPASPQARMKKDGLSPGRDGKQGSSSEQAPVFRVSFYFRFLVLGQSLTSLCLEPSLWPRPQSL